MTIRELKDLVNAIPESDDEHLVILQRDPEGNGYAPAENGADAAVWSPEEEQVYSHPESEEDGEEEDEEECEEECYVPEDGVPCYVLWPTR